jgi:hypothetical protein
MNLISVKLRTHNKKQSKGSSTRTSMDKTAAGTASVHACSSASNAPVVRRRPTAIYFTRPVVSLALQLLHDLCNERRKMQHAWP